MIPVLVFCSGFAALVYQVLWLRDLSILFGSSAHAAAIDLAAFFAGLAGGAAIIARLAPRMRRPLRVYAFLELGIALSALLFLALLDVYAWLYAPIYRALDDRFLPLLLVKIVLAFAVLAPPTLLMGATLPAIVQHRGGGGAWLYGINTIGATAGAFAAGFYLPPALGFRTSYLLAVGLNVAIGVLALLQRQTPTEVPPAPAPPRPAKRSAPAPHDPLTTGLAATMAVASGVLSIGLEIVWLRMFAQVLDNSIYAFSAIVVVALVAFGVAALLVARLQQPAHPVAWLAVILSVCGLLAVMQAPAFVAYTGTLAQVQGSGWSSYLGRVFAMAALFVGVLGFAAGLVFPSLLRFVRSGAPVGTTIGRLLMLNTAGAILGSLLTTFVLLPALGVWPTCGAIGLAYAALGVWTSRQARRPRATALAGVLAAVTVALIVVLPGLPRLRLDEARAERVMEIWESGHGTVAVTATRHGRILRLNNSYSLGGTVDRIERERIQTLIPLLLHPRPQQVFFLGLGTGITAGEALRHPVDRVVVCELVPEVVDAAERHFGEWTRGLAGDPRVEIRVEDGRHYLAASGDSFDVIVSDLFVPWHAGTGQLYTREHFEVVRSRLRPGGLFAQWLPLFQLSQPDFEVIARTLLDVFPHVVVWRADFYDARPVVALIASVEPMPIDPAALVKQARQAVPAASEAEILAGVLPFYAGNLAAGRAVLEPGPSNTDERPVIEYRAPATQWSADGGTPPWFVSVPLVRFLARLRAEAPPEHDPYLAALSPTQRGYVEAGDLYYRAIVSRLRGQDDAAQLDLAGALERLPEALQVGGPFLGLDALVR